MTQVELLPCPLCAGAVQFHGCDPVDNSTLTCHYIHCAKCGGMFDLSGDSNPDELDELQAVCAERWNTRTPSPASPSPVAAGQIADLQARLARKVMELASLEYAVRHHLNDKSMGADIASILDNTMRCIFMTHGNWDTLSSQAPKPASAGGEIWTVIDEARRIALAADDGMDMKHCSHLINAIKAYDASGCGPILNVAAEADTATKREPWVCRAGFCERHGVIHV